MANKKYYKDAFETKKKKIIEFIDDIEKIAWDKGYDQGYEDGKLIGISYIFDAANWFHETYGTEYVIYDSGSIEHLMDMYKEAKGE